MQNFLSAHTPYKKNDMLAHVLQKGLIASHTYEHV